MTWTALTSTVDTGGTAITSYQLDMSADAGSTWIDLVGFDSQDTSTSFTRTTVTAGSTYHFRVRAKNALDWGAYSDMT